MDGAAIGGKRGKAGGGVDAVKGEAGEVDAGQNAFFSADNGEVGMLVAVENEFGGDVAAPA